MFAQMFEQMSTTPPPKSATLRSPTQRRTHTHTPVGTRICVSAGGVRANPIQTRKKHEMNPKNHPKSRPFPSSPPLCRDAHLRVRRRTMTAIQTRNKPENTAAAAVFRHCTPFTPLAQCTALTHPTRGQLNDHHPNAHRSPFGTPSRCHHHLSRDCQHRLSDGLSTASRVGAGGGRRDHDDGADRLLKSGVHRTVTLTLFKDHGTQAPNVQPYQNDVRRKEDQGYQQQLPVYRPHKH
jgi:hypothetical protein